MRRGFRGNEVGVLLLLIISFVNLCGGGAAAATMSKVIGIDYGQLGDNLPSPSRSVSLIQSLKAGFVKIYDANPQILRALSKTHLKAAVMLPNELVPNISASQSLSDAWVRTNLLPFFPHTKIRILLVGNELLSPPNGNATWSHIVPAMTRLRKSLKSHGLRKIKVGTTVAMDALQTSFPPSAAAFRRDIAVPVMGPLLRFLNRTKSFFFLDAYTYFPWSSDPTRIRLDYALLEPETGVVGYTDPGTGFRYADLLDQMLDAVAYAMERVGYPDVRIWIAETGWPNGGDVDQVGANIRNAAVYNRNLARKLSAGRGTPARPGSVIRAFVFSLYNEDLKPGPGTERHWGLMYPNGTAVYEVDLTGEKPESEYAPLPPATNDEPYRGKIWCVAAEGAEKKTAAVEAAVEYACGQGNGTCDAIRPGGECYRKGRESAAWKASYAFNSYWHQFRSVGGTCYFGGLAVQTTKDLSHGRCKFPGTTV
ncbi:hypothetical protein H6P81_012165 [Aristolochia fimbriata]|uniref:glucan endo-1,3-beta-D-glucosidase n=1 Tax=Aristolochia fimbriata TaxID=158543 RepID=A0AAV7EEQ8_ARIFI|nr:hypothetical protein H6P81_012165 [Aristolochia fimbriata]